MVQLVVDKKMGSAYRARIHMKDHSNPISSVVTLQEARVTRESDPIMTHGGTLVLEPLPLAVHQFMRDLVAAHSDDSSFDIVVDNAKSGETAKKWNAIRRSSSRRCSLPTPTRWSSDSGISLQLASSPEDTRRTLHREGGSAAPSNNGLITRRNSLDPCDINRSSSSSISTRTMKHPQDVRSRNGSAVATPDCNAWNTKNANYPQRRESSGSTYSSPLDSEPAQEISSGHVSDESESDYSDYFTSDVDELEQSLRRKSRKPVHNNKENPVTPSESALSLALISTIERLSVRAALALCRPQTSSVAQAETMQTIDEAMELLPSRGRVTDVSTSSRNRRTSSSAANVVAGSYLSAGDEDTETTINTISKEEQDAYDPASPQQLHHPQLLACKQQSDLNGAMLAAIDRLSVRAALTLTDLSSEFSHDEKSCDEA